MLRGAVVVLACMLVALATACEDEDTTASPTATAPFETPTSAPSAEPTGGPGPTQAGGPNEHGQSPVFWRTADDFASVVKQTPYLVVFRIEGGFDEPSLTVTATCVDCASPDEQTFLGTNSPPVGEDAPGAYYPVSMTFPRAGKWELTVLAGADEVTVPVVVQPAP